MRNSSSNEGIFAAGAVVGNTLCTANRVYDLSTALGGLRIRSDKSAELLRSTAQVCICVNGANGVHPSLGDQTAARRQWRNV